MIAPFVWTMLLTIPFMTAVPIIIAMMLAIGDGSKMRALAILPWLRLLGWTAAALMAATAAALLLSRFG